MAALPPQVLHTVVEAACQAPSVHNTQPWRWVSTRAGVALYADLGRRLMRTDPVGRDLVMSCGAALHTMCVAAAAAGYRARVQRLPDPADSSLLADVRFVPEPPDEEALALAEAIGRRRTDRRPPTSWPVPPERLATPIRISAQYGVRATDVTSVRDATPIPKLVEEAQRLQSFDKGYHDELHAWSESRGGVGVPPENVPDRHSDQGDAGTGRFPAGGLSATGGEDEPVGAAWLLLSTSSDDALSWLRAGESLQAVWLWATTQGFAVVPYSQPLEVERTRALLQREHLKDTSCPQLLVRIGWPSLSAPPVPATPRRGADSVLGS